MRIIEYRICENNIPKTLWAFSLVKKKKINTFYVTQKEYSKTNMHTYVHPVQPSRHFSEYYIK